MNRELLNELRKAVAVAAGDYDMPGAERLASRIAAETKTMLLDALAAEEKCCLPPNELEKEAQEFGKELDAFLTVALGEGVMSGRQCADTPSLFARRNGLVRTIGYLFESARRTERRRVAAELQKACSDAFKQVSW